MKKKFFDIPLVIQKEDECGPANLLQVLKYYNINPNLEEIISFCKTPYKGREWDYLMGLYALQKQLMTKIHTKSLTVFDSTWFGLRKDKLIEKLKKEKEYFSEISEKIPAYKKLELEATHAIIFLRNDGEISFKSFSHDLIRNYLSHNIPVIVTVNVQSIYKLPRERNEKEDDIRGMPWKHILTINGFDDRNYYVTDTADYKEQHKYKINSNLLLDATIRYDNNIITLRKRS